LAGDQSRSQDLAKRFPLDSVVKVHDLPTIQAQLALSLSRNNLSSAIEAALTTLPMNWEYRFPRSILRLYILFIAQNKPIGALAHLQIGRAYAMQGDTPKAKAAYQDFLTL
jgi:eukaryotic-like serine/threonine-protein kinase